jgi:Pectate lyase superfamily protein
MIDADSPFLKYATRYIWTLLAMIALLPGRGFSLSPIEVYNVKSYGATGNGTTDDSAAIQLAINAAIAGGGTVYFPAGTYAIKAAVQDLSMNATNLVGNGVNATTLLISGSSGSLTLSDVITGPYHAGAIKDFSVRCSGGTDGGQTGITTQDAVGLKFSNITVASCGTAIDMRDVHYWSERNDFDDVTFFDDLLAVHFDAIAGDPYIPTASFGYNSFRVWVDTDSPGTVFRLTGGGYAYSSFYSVRGNIAVGSTIFDARSDGYAESFGTNTYIVQVEDQGSGSGTSFVFDDSVISGPNGGIYGTSFLTYGAKTRLYSPGSVYVGVSQPDLAAQDLGSFVTTATSSNTYTSLLLAPTSVCFATPANATAAAMTGVWVSSVSWGQLVLSHPSIAGAQFHLWCHR